MEDFYALSSLVNIEHLILSRRKLPAHQAFAVYPSGRFSMEPIAPIHSSRAPYFRSNFLFSLSSDIYGPMLVPTM
jgi:hypothetical protein